MNNNMFNRPYYPPPPPACPPPPVCPPHPHPHPHPHPPCQPPCPPPMTVNTRIALRIDSVECWKRSLQPLYPGEIAVSYRIAPDGTRYDFRLKSGCRDKYGNCLAWSQLPFIGEDMVPTAAEISAELSDVFAGKGEAGSTDIAEISAALSGVFAKKDDQLGIEQISALLSDVFAGKGEAGSTDIAEISARLSDVFVLNKGIDVSEIVE